MGDFIDIVAEMPAQHELDLVTAVPAVHACHPAAQGGLLGGLEIVGEIADALQTPPDKIVRAITVAGLQTSLHVSETCRLAHLKVSLSSPSGCVMPTRSLATAATTSDSAVSSSGRMELFRLLAFSARWRSLSSLLNLPLQRK